MEEFKALLLEQEDGGPKASIRNLTESDLPDGDVLVDVEYSSLNYKDGLAITGKGKIVRTWPMVPGVDLAGVVRESQSPDYAPGDKVVLTGWSVGEKYWGGYAQRQRLRSEWLVPLPEGLDSRNAMAIGTAGLTSMLCVLALDEGGVAPSSGPVLVTGAGGGVGSVAVALLAARAYTVTAVIGRAEEEAFVRDLGASEVISGEQMNKPARPLETQKWSGAIDVVGSHVLARVLAEMDSGGCVASCGLAGGFDLPTTVMPFILRGVRLQGVDSVMCPLPRRKAAWDKLAAELPASVLDAIGNTARLEDLPKLAEDIVAGRIRGRILVDLKA